MLPLWRIPRPGAQDFEELIASGRSGEQSWMRLLILRGNSLREQPAYRTTAPCSTTGSYGSCSQRWPSPPVLPSTGLGCLPLVQLPSCSQFFHASRCAPCTFVRTKALVAVARTAAPQPLATSYMLLAR